MLIKTQQEEAELIKSKKADLTVVLCTKGWENRAQCPCQLTHEQVHHRHFQSREGRNRPDGLKTQPSCARLNGERL